MKILVIGGTQFVGRHFAEAALSAGHEVTLFHRGTKGVGSVKGASDVLGDRTENLDRVASQHWDLVTDSSAYLPSVTKQSVQALKEVCDRYLFVSTVSVYDRGNGESIFESSPLTPIGDPDATVVNGETYGYLKVLCEREVEAAFRERSLLIRPGIVAGSYDPTDRFTHWVTRFAGGGKVLVPNVPSSKLQLVDARDLGEFMVHASEQNLSGAYNVAGPPSTFGDMIQTCSESSADSEVVWLDPSGLERLDLKLWQDFPLATVPGEDNLFAASSAAAVAKGLKYRDLASTVQDVLTWKSAAPGAAAARVGISRDRELEVLAELTNPS
jgi:2'-hydroxyisoflavone reductase